VRTPTWILLAVTLALLIGPARGEAVYDFVGHCRNEQLSRCFDRIGERLNRLNAGAHRRICLPRTFGGLMLGSGVIPVSLLEHVRLTLSAARFGDAGTDVDDMMARIVNAIYPCNPRG